MGILCLSFRLLFVQSKRRKDQHYQSDRVYQPKGHYGYKGKVNFSGRKERKKERRKERNKGRKEGRKRSLRRVAIFDTFHSGHGYRWECACVRILSLSPNIPGQLEVGVDVDRRRFISIIMMLCGARQGWHTSEFDKSKTEKNVEGKDNFGIFFLFVSLLISSSCSSPHLPRHL